MKLEKETVATAIKELAEAYGTPQHIQTREQMDRLITLYHRELSKLCTEEKFPDALTIAWQQARRFPVVADFHRGFDAPKGGRHQVNEVVV